MRPYTATSRCTTTDALPLNTTVRPYTATYRCTTTDALSLNTNRASLQGIVTIVRPLHIIIRIELGVTAG